MAGKREPSPYEVIEKMHLSQIPGGSSADHFVRRVLAGPTDFEIILAQGYEIASLRAKLAERDRA